LGDCSSCSPGFARATDDRRVSAHGTGELQTSDTGKFDHSTQLPTSTAKRASDAVCFRPNADVPLTRFDAEKRTLRMHARSSVRLLHRSLRGQPDFPDTAPSPDHSASRDKGMSRSLFAELKRRNVFKAGIAYLALGWVVTQVTSTVAPAFNLPGWI